MASKSWSFKILSITVLSVLFLSGIFAVTPALLVSASGGNSYSSNVAYVSESSTWGGGSMQNGLFSWAVTTPCTGVSPDVQCTMTTTGGNSVTLTYVDVSTIDANPTTALSGFDTVFLYQVCDIGSVANANLMTAINSFLNNGGKVIIYDGDYCAPSDGGSPDYSTFLFPFTSSNPGPQGATASPTFIETETAPATLTRGLSSIPTTGTDAIGDSNTFVTYNGAWCVAEAGPNVLGVTGPQIAYATTSAGGLVIYNGNDNAFTFTSNAWDTATFNNALDQPWNPSSLPCGVVASGITLTPATATNPVGTSHTVTATVLDPTGSPVAGVTVTFAVTSGPDAGATGTGVTNSNGQATFTYSNTGGAGTDTIVASFTDNSGNVHNSNTATKTWTESSSTTTTTTTHGVPQFGPGNFSTLIMVAAGLGALTVFMRAKRSGPIQRPFA